MAQLPKIIDITQSYIPVDPRTYPSNLHGTNREDFPVDAAPVVAYDGKNFLPTPYGYKSFFGVNTAVDLTALPASVDSIFVVQTATLNNILVALCADGIWYADAETPGAWVHYVELDAPEEGSYLQWTHCMIEDTVFMYRATDPVYYKLKLTPTEVEVEEEAPAYPAPTVTYYTGAGGIPNGAYEYAIAPVTVAGVQPMSIYAPVVVTATGAVLLTWSAISGATKYRIYRKNPDGSVRYYETADITYSLYDNNQTPTGTFTSTTDPEIIGIMIAAGLPMPVTPTFLNMEGQQGIFKAVGRLGFWDSDNSVAWSSIDDFADFTPSITTLAGSAKFVEVVGKIINIKSHGKGFIIYATKCIVYVRQNVEATFQWDPKVVFNNSGIAFLEECCASTPDTTHFVWTTTGFYKIEEGREELITPELYSYLSEMEDPVSLQVLEGRYLYLQLIDPNYLAGRSAFRVVTVLPTVINFPSSPTVEDVADPIELVGNDACYNLNLITQVHAATGGAKPGDADPADPDTADSPYMRPVYRAYFSQGSSGNPDTIEWVHPPCGITDLDGQPFNFAPGSDVGTLDSVSDDASTKLIMEDTTFDTLSFTATQLAIWRIEDQRRKAFLDKIIARAISQERVEEVVSCDIVPKNRSECEIGTYISRMSDPHWGMNSCSFWLTRYVIEVTDVNRIAVTETQCEQPDPIGAAWGYQGTVGDYNHVPYLSPTYDQCLLDIASHAATAGYTGELCAVMSSQIGPFTWTGWFGNPPHCGNFGAAWVRHVSSCPVGSTDIHSTVLGISSVTVACQAPGFTRTRRLNAYNTGIPRAPGVFKVDTAWLVLVGWKYRDVNGDTQFIPRTGEDCPFPPKPDRPPSGSSGSSGGVGNLPISPIDGNICGIPFESISIPGLEFAPLTWPEQSVTIPEASFLLQRGSIGPVYPTFEGAFVYDLHFKKWGKFQHQYKRLVDYSPITSTSGQIIDYTNFGITSGILGVDGFVYIFDNHPEESYIKYGKIGYYRLGLTSLEEVHAHFSSSSTGYLQIEASLDGQNIEVMFDKSAMFQEANIADLFTNLNAKWYNIAIKGHYDLMYLEFRGNKTSRR